MRKDQRNLVLSLALAGTVLAGATAPLVAGATVASFNAFDKWMPGAPVASAFLKENPSAPVAASNIFIKFNSPSS